MCCLYIAPFMLGYAGWYTRDGYREFLFYVPFQQILIIGPATYFYLRSLIHEDHRFVPKDVIHFVPGIMYNLYIGLICMIDFMIFDGDHFYSDGRDKDLVLWYQIAGFLSMAGYFGLSLKIYLKYRKAIYNSVSYADEITFTWVGRFLAALLGLLILRVLFFILNPEWAEFGSKFWYYVMFSIIFYFIAIYGYRHSVKRESVNLIPIPKKESLVEVRELITIDKSQNYKIDDLNEWKSKIDARMKDKRLFSSPQLSLLDVAKELDTNPRHISQIINQGYDMNFNDFVNQYRSREVVEKILKGEHIQKTLLSLALECGFNSKSTFNRAFKKYTGQTPAEYSKRGNK